MAVELWLAVPVGVTVVVAVELRLGVGVRVWLCEAVREVDTVREHVGVLGQGSGVGGIRGGSEGRGASGDRVMADYPHRLTAPNHCCHLTCLAMLALAQI